MQEDDDDDDDDDDRLFFLAAYADRDKPIRVRIETFDMDAVTSRRVTMTCKNGFSPTQLIAEIIE